MIMFNHIAGAALLVSPPLASSITVANWPATGGGGEVARA
jgi:hypothetical protein